MSSPREIVRRISEGASWLAAVAVIGCGVRWAIVRLPRRSLPEHSASWAEAARSLPAQRIGILCDDPSNIDSVERARMIAVSWENCPQPVMAVGLSKPGDWPPVVMASSYLSEPDQARIRKAGYHVVSDNDFAAAWSCGDIVPSRRESPVSAGREAVGVSFVLAVMVLFWRGLRIRSENPTGAGEVICALAVFAVSAAVALCHGLIPPNGLGVYAGKARLLLMSGGVPEGFFSSPDYACYQPSYPPGLTCLALIAYAVSGSCGTWLIQLIVPLSSALLFLELAGDSRRRLSSAIALAVVVCPVALKMASGFYAEPLAALLLAMGTRRIIREDGILGWLLLGASGLFRHECLLLVICILIARPFSARRTNLAGTCAALALPAAWQALAWAQGARIYDFDFTAWPDLSRTLMAFSRLFSWQAILACVLLVGLLERRSAGVVPASVAFMLCCAVAMGFNASLHFEWLLGNAVPRVVWLSLIPSVAQGLFPCANLQCAKHPNRTISAS
jgi:hypothetical protein